MAEQQDDHCYIVFQGRDWYIDEIHGGRLWCSGPGQSNILIDIRRVNWHAYADAAERALEREFPREMHMPPSYYTTDDIDMYRIRP